MEVHVKLSDTDYGVINSECLPDYMNPTYGDVFVFSADDTLPTRTLTVHPHGNQSCEGCFFDDKDLCPWDPEAGDPLCDIYDCRFTELDKIMEEV